MRQVLWILRKDIGRLWGAAALSLVPLAALATVDRWRSDWQVSAWEGWLNLLVPLAWASMLMLAVREEPPAAERHCWRTWPYRWTALLAAKLVFAALFVHLPLLLADGFVLSAHGFGPAEAWPALLSKQALVAAVVTAPALALASVCRQAAHFALGATLLLGAAAWLAVGTMPVFPWSPPDPLRHTLPAAVAAVGSACVIIRQYHRGHTVTSRAVGAAAAALAALLLGSLSPVAAARLRGSWIAGRAPLEMRPGPGAAAVRDTGRVGVIEITLPVTTTGLPEGSELAFDAPVVSMAAAGKPAEPVFAALPRDGGHPVRLTLLLRRAQFDQWRARPVSFSGHAVARVARRGPTAWLAAGTRGRIPGVGLCASTVVAPWSAFHEGALKVLCESTTAIAPETEVRLYQPASGGTWVHRLGDSAAPSTGPRGEWLSPLHRLQTYFHCAPGISPEMASSWLVPPEALPGAHVGITPARVEVWGVMEIQLEGVPFPQSAE